LQSTTPPQSKHKPWLHYGLGALILLGFAVFVEAFVGWGTLLRPWQNLALGPMAAAIILVFVSYGLRALRVYDYFRPQMQPRFGLCLRLSLQHNLLNNLLPMRTGELSFPILMARYFQIPLLNSGSALLWFRLLDLHALLGFGLLAAGDQLLGLGTNMLLLVPWLLLPWLGFRLYRPWLAACDGRQGQLWSLGRKVLGSLPQNPRHFWRSFAWTQLNWGIKLAVFAWVLQLFATMPWGAAWVGVMAGDLTSVLPIHGIAGAGTYEAGVVAGLATFQVDAALALQAAVNLHLFVLGCTLLSGVLSLLLPRGAAQVARNSSVGGQ
jgi:uncharacterized membrane protein YbhN (UPF0104 family)